MIPTQAKVVYLTAPRQCVVRSEPLPDLGIGDLLCETLVTAISPGTELAAYQGLPPLRMGVAYPRLQGYCNVARVLEIGSSVRGIATGDRVLSFRSHRSHFVIPAADVLFRMPAEAKVEDIVCTYLFHLGYNAVLRAGVLPGSRTLVIGLGVLGLTSVALAHLAGATVVAVSDQPSSHAVAREFGVNDVYARSSPVALLNAFGGELADVVITTTNSWADWRTALQLAGQLGVIACLGFPGRGEAPAPFNPLDSQFFYAKQLRIQSVGLSPEVPDGRGFVRFNERDNLKFLANQIIAGRLRPSLLVSGTYRGEDIDRAYTDLIARRNSPLTYLLAWSPE